MLKRERQRISYRYEGSQRWEPRNKCSHQMLDETRNSFFFRASERYAALPTPWFQRSGFQKCDTIFLWIQSPGRKTMTNLNSILKSRDITLLSKVHTVKVMVFPAVMYGCESWTIKKAECWRIDAFELWCWRRLLRVSWTARRSNQSIKGSQPWIFIGRTDAESWSSNTSATWCEKLTHWKRPWCWQRQKARGKGDDRGWDGWIASLTQWTWVWASSGRWWQGSLERCSPWGHKETDMTEWLNKNQSVVACYSSHRKLIQLLSFCKGWMRTQNPSQFKALAIKTNFLEGKCEV